MLLQKNNREPISKEDYKIKKDALELKLYTLQQTLKEKKLPVMIVFEGFEAAGKGSMISSIIANLDPRGYKVFSIDSPNESEKRLAPMARFWDKLPEYGQVFLYDRSWYWDVYKGWYSDELSHSQALKRLAECAVFERQLSDDGYLIIKFFLNISKKEQEKRFEKLMSNKSTQWRVTKEDLKCNKDYDRLKDIYEQTLLNTGTRLSPWNIVDSTEKRGATLEVFSILINEMEKALMRQRDDKAPECLENIIIDTRFALAGTAKLSQLDLSQSVSEKKYSNLLKKKQEKLRLLHSELYKKKIPVVIAYEGFDAAGKGGNIKRLAQALDPRGFEVNPISAPTKPELNHHYLWRFWNKLPRTGHISIFDRSWYGRVLVERVERFATYEQFTRAYDEINEFEAQICDWGAIVLKFFIVIDKDEQLTRFEQRQNTPEKQWKITDEDWRNREKWDAYTIAIDDMLHYTSTVNAKWELIESNDKHFARLKVLDIVIDAIEKRLN